MMKRNVYVHFCQETETLKDHTTFKNRYNVTNLNSTMVQTGEFIFTPHHWEKTHFGVMVHHHHNQKMVTLITSHLVLDLMGYHTPSTLKTHNILADFLWVLEAVSNVVIQTILTEVTVPLKTGTIGPSWRSSLKN